MQQARSAVGSDPLGGWTRARNGRNVSSTLAPSAAPFARALSDAVEASGLGLENIAARLREREVEVSIATRSYRQSGNRVPTARARRSSSPTSKVFSAFPHAAWGGKFTHPDLVGHTRQVKRGVGIRGV